MLLHEVCLLLAALAGLLSSLWDDRLRVKRQLSSPRVLAVFFCLLTCCGLTSEHDHGVRMDVEEGSDVILPCSLDNKQNITAGAFDWKKEAPKDQRQKEVFFYYAGFHYNNGRDGQSKEFKGRVSHFEDQLNQGNASIIIRNTKMADSGNYICVFPLLQPRQTFYIELVVAAAPEPFIRTLHATEVWSLLQCEVRGASPQPAVEWQDSDGNKLPAEEPQVSERGGSYNITVNITVTKTGRYRCVVEQEHMCTETFVHICEKVCEDSSTKVAIGFVCGLVLGVSIVLSVQALPVRVKWIPIRCKNTAGCLQEGSSLNEHDVKKPLQEDPERQ